MAKRGDTKTQNGVTYRYGYKNGKLQWIRSHTKFNPRIGDKLKSTWKGAKNLGSNVSRKVFGNPKTNANKKYQSTTWKKKPNNKMASFREDTKANQQLQKEHKSGSDITYQRVTSNNKKNLSNQQVDKPSDKKSSGKKMHSIEKKNREIHGDEAINKLKAKHAKWKADRKKAREERRKKRLKAKK